MSMGKQQERAKRLKRLQRAARQLKRMEEMEMLRLQGRMEALQRQRCTLLETLGQGALGSGELARMLRRNLKAMGEEQARLDAMLAEAMESLRQRRLQERHIETMQQRAGKTLEQGRARDALLDIAERAAMHRRSLR